LATKERQLEAMVKQLEATVKQLEATVEQMEATVKQMEVTIKQMEAELKNSREAKEESDSRLEAMLQILDQNQEFFWKTIRKDVPE
jgi:septal ring factor EnvC (AmiA/AmiB activator)